MNSDTVRQSASTSLLVLPLIMEEWLSSSRNPSVICDAQQRVLWHSANLLGFLDHVTCIKLDRDSLVLADKRAQAALSRFIQSPDMPTSVIALEGERQTARSILQCRRLGAGSNVNVFGLRIINDDNYRESAVLHFEEYFNLTRQEALICRDLLRGKTVQEIVETTGKSSDTVRFHIRNIYIKIDVSSREALFAKLRLFLFG